MITIQIDQIQPRSVENSDILADPQIYEHKKSCEQPKPISSPTDLPNKKDYLESGDTPN